MHKNIVVKYESIEPFIIKLNDFLSGRGIAVGSVTEVVFSVKNKVTDADEDAVVTKTFSNGDVVFGTDTEGNDVISVAFDYADYGSGKLEIGSNYFLGIGFETAVHTKLLEGTWATSPPTLQVVQDFFRG